MRLKLSIISALIIVLSALAAVVSPAAEAAKPGTGGPLVTSADGVTQAGQAVDGTFAISRFRVVDGAITAIGTFTGSVAEGPTRTVAASAPVAALAPGATCEILDLTLGPLHLDLLGLVVDLDTVNLQITAVPGAGNLLGNLLCAVAGLLDGPTVGGGGLNGLLNSVVALLNQILGQL